MSPDVVTWAAAERLYWEQAAAALERAKDVEDHAFRRQARQAWAKRHGFQELPEGASKDQYKQWRQAQDKALLRKLTAARSTSAAALSMFGGAAASGAPQQAASSEHAGLQEQPSAASINDENDDPERDVELEQLEQEEERLLECAPSS